MHHLRKVAAKIGSLDFKTWDRRREFADLVAKCRDGYQAIYQNPKGKLFEMENFLLDENRTVGKLNSDGSKIFIKGWMNVVNVDGYYQLFSMNGNFGFCNGKGNLSLEAHAKICNKARLKDHQGLIQSYLIDDTENVIYLVTEFIFSGKPEELDLFYGTKKILLVKERQKVGFIDDGKLYDANEIKKIFGPTSMSAIMINPMAAMYLSI
ncbi:MAG: hypothetical protein PHE32_00905 [Candidatus Shapirobacteria bacterium]|nr:hypothetical protein [Candidatus Shapirobacteria bacterium]MDD4410251.1 hypothetical protein [Candidatus Shapirobacteria bacterium]